MQRSPGWFVLVIKEGTRRGEFSFCVIQEITYRTQMFFYTWCTDKISVNETIFVDICNSRIVDWRHEMYVYAIYFPIMEFPVTHHLNEKNCVRNSFWIFLQFLIYSVTFFFYTKYHYQKHMLLEISRLNLHKCQASVLHLLRIYTFMFHCAWKFNTSCQNCIWLFQDLHTPIEGKGSGA